MMKNKEVILEDEGIIQKFKGKLVRCVIKSTQRYAELLNYLVHPSCAKNFIEREKLFENMWGYPHKNKNVVKYEVNDMLFHDVPIFYTRCDSRNLWSSTGEVIENFYSISGYERVINRILKDKNDKFNSISSELNIDAPISYIEESMKVGDDLLNKAIYSEDKK